MEKQKVFVIVVAVVLSLIVTLFGVFSYPPPHGNSALFIPAAVNFAQGKGLINEASHLAEWIDKSGNFKFLTYPPLFPVFLGILILPNPTAYGVLFTVAMLEVLIIILSTLVFLKIATIGGEKLTWFKAILVGFALVATVSPFQNFSTRSDLLFQLTLLLAMLAAIHLFRSKYLWIFLAALLGVAAATHPMYIVMLLALVGLFIAARNPAKAVFFEMIKTFGGGIALFLLLMAVTPLGFIEKMRGVFTHSGVYGKGGWFWFGSDPYQGAFSQYLNEFVMRFFVNPVSFFSGVFFLLFVIVATRLYFDNRKKVGSPFFFNLFLVFFSLALLTIVARPVTVYYFQMLSPFTFAAVIYAFRSLNFSKIFNAGAVAVFALISVGFVRQAALFPSFLKDGVSLREARAAYEEIKPKACLDRCVGLASAGLWPLTEDYKIAINSLQAKNLGKELGDVVDVILFQQAYSGRITPPESIDDCALDKNYFVEKQPKILGLKLGSAVPGYGFASYLCK